MRLRRRDAEQIMQHARAGLPNEACGLLGGAGDLATAVYCLENAHHSPVSYELTEAGYQLLVELDERGELLGVFHSHTEGAPYPSYTDRRQAYWPVYYLIVSMGHVAGPALRCFRLTKSDPLDAQALADVVEENLEIIDGDTDS